MRIRYQPHDRPQMMGKYEEGENPEYVDEIADIISRTSLIRTAAVAAAWKNSG